MAVPFSIPPIFEGYVARFATPEETGSILSFYADETHRTKAVYLRKPEIIHQQIQAGLFLTVRNKHNQLVAASSVYSLAGGQEIDCVAEGKKVIEKGRVYEVGSVLRWGDTPNADGRLPEGFWHPFLIGIMEVEVFRRGESDLKTDLLVGNVQSDRTANIQRLTGQTTPTPFAWKLFEPAQALEKAFGETTEDPNAQRTKQYFRATPSDLPNIATYLYKSRQRGYLTNRNGGKLGIDLSDLPIHETIEDIITHPSFFKSPRGGIDKRSWAEMSRQFTGVKTRPPEIALTVISRMSNGAGSRPSRRPVASGGGGSATALAYRQPY
jgi:hypothetical protein